MKKTLFSIVFLGSLLGFVGHSNAAVSCAPGDIFDILTGKACVVSITDKDALIASLQTQIISLQTQITLLQNRIGSVSTSTVYAMTLDAQAQQKEQSLESIDVKILPLLQDNPPTYSIYDESVVSTINSYLRQYKTIDPLFPYYTVLPTKGYGPDGEALKNAKMQLYRDLTLYINTRAKL